MRRISNPISIFIVALTLCCGAGAGAKAFVSKDYDRVKHKNIIVAKSNDKYFAEHITSEFLTIGISVIDRQNTDAMMQELQLGQEGVIAPNAAKQIGQITGADAMLILEW